MKSLGTTENSVYAEKENEEEGPAFDCDFVTQYLDSQRFVSFLDNSGLKISRVKEDKMIRTCLARLLC